MLFVLRRNSIGADLYVICPSTLIFRYYYSIEELGGREGGGGGVLPGACGGRQRILAAPFGAGSTDSG